MRKADVGILFLLLLLLGGVVVALLLVGDTLDPPDGDGARAQREDDDLIRPGPPVPSVPPPTIVRPAIRHPPTVHTSIEGRVIGLPVDLAMLGRLAVVVDGEEIRAPLEPSGRFTIWNLPAGRPHDLLLAFGEGPAETALASGITLSRGERRKLDLTLGEVCVLCGVVTDAAGRPRAGANLALLSRTLDWRDPGTRIRARTDRDGRFAIVEAVEDGAWEAKLVVEAVADGYVVEERLVLLLPASVQRHGVALRMGKRIAGVVVGPGGEPIAGASVRIVEDLGEDPTNGTLPVIGLKETDADGSFEDDAFRPGPHRIYVRGRFRGHPFLLVEEGVPAGREDLTLRFAGFGSARLRFEDRVTWKEVPVANGVLQRICAQRGDSFEWEDWAEFSDRGEVLLENLPAGHYRVNLSHTGYRPVTGDTIHVASGESVGPLTYKLSPIPR